MALHQATFGNQAQVSGLANGNSKMTRPLGTVEAIAAGVLCRLCLPELTDLPFPLPPVLLFHIALLASGLIPGEDEDTLSGLNRESV